MWNKDLTDFLLAATEASVFIAPRAPGLTAEELFEVAAQAGYQRGEASDALQPLSNRCHHLADGRLAPNHTDVDFNFPRDPDPRSPQAFEFVRVFFRNLAKSEGEAKARAARNVVVQRGVGEGLQEMDVEAAVTVLLLAGHLVGDVKTGTLAFAQGRLTWGLPSEQIRNRGRGLPNMKSPHLGRAWPIVKDVVGRRSDGRLPVADPLDQFALLLEGVGHGRFRLWWDQTRAELRQCDNALQTTTATVLSAALAEGALAFVAPHAKNVGPMPVLDLGKPRTWRFIDLIKGASSGGGKAIIDDQTKNLCMALNDDRQRIHAGYLIDTVPTGHIPDIKPDVAAQARHTLNMLVRQIVEWLVRHPPSPPAT